MSRQSRSSERSRTSPVYRDRTQAGAALAGALAQLDLADPLVLAMARGGVPVGVEVARRLGGGYGPVDLDVIVSRKIGAPGHPELAVGAVGENDVVLVERAAVDGLGIDDRQLEAMIGEAQQELARRVALYRGDAEMRDVAGRQVVVVDDGVATGHTARAALDSLVASDPERLILAVPVCPRATVGMFNDIELVCLSHPQPFVAVGKWYENFDQVSDSQVLELLNRSSSR